MGDTSADDIINKIFTPDKIKAFQDDIRQDIQNSTQDRDQPKTEKRGRKNRGLTTKHKKEYNEYRRVLTNIERPDNFKPDIIERVSGEIINDSEIERFKELYQLTCETVLDDFKTNNPDLVKKHPYTWYKNLLIELKKNVPAVTYEELDKLEIVWDCLTWLLNEIGLYITYETFQLFTKVYDYQLKKMGELSPKYIDFRKKIYTERDHALVNELQYNPYNQTNKMFIAKVHGIVEKTEPKQIEVTHNIQTFDNIARYRLQDQEKND